MLGAIAFAAFLVFFFLNLVPFPGSWTMEEVVSFQEGKAKGKDKASEHLVGWMISHLFTPQVGCWAAAFLAALMLLPWQVIADATAAAHPFARVGVHTLVGRLIGILTLGDVFSFMGHLHASVLPLSLGFDGSVLQASDEVRQQAAAAMGTTMLSPRRGVTWP